MRKTVKRSIVAWPAAAAAVITVASAANTFLQTPANSRRAVEKAASQTDKLSSVMRRAGYSQWLDQREGESFAIDSCVASAMAGWTVGRPVEVAESLTVEKPIAIGNANPSVVVKTPIAGGNAAVKHDNALNRRIAAGKLALGQFSDVVDGLGEMVKSFAFQFPIRLNAPAAVSTDTMSADLLASYPIFGNPPITDYVRFGVDNGSLGPISSQQHGRFNLTQIAAAGADAAGHPSIAMVRPHGQRSRQIEQPRLFPGNRVLSKPVLNHPKPSDLETPATHPPEPDSAAVKAPRRTLVKNFGSWPAASSLRSLMDQIDRQSIAPEAVDSASILITSNIRHELERLRSIGRLSDPASAGPLGELARLARESVLRGEALTDRDDQIAWLRLGHAVARRADTWSAIHHIAANPTTSSSMFQTTEASTDASITRGDVAAAVQVLHRDLDQTGDVDGWRDYLMLDEIESALMDPSVERLSLAQAFLSRLHYHAMDADAREFVARDSVTQLAKYIRPWAGGAVDYAKLMQQIERLESDPTDLASMEIADAIATLSHYDSPSVIRLAEVMTTHYQNANVRIAVSEELINRLVPTIGPQTKPIRTRVLGSDVRGVSTVRSDVRIRFKPSPTSWLMSLQTLGNVKTRSTGTREGVSVLTDGRNTFTAQKNIEINRDGVQADPTQVGVTGDSVLRDVTSQYDNWPLVGSLVQTIAKSTFENSLPAANQIAASRIRGEVSREMDSRIEEQTASATNKLGEVFFGPMAQMRLDPQVMELRTTAERLVARYRVAGAWQLAAFTPRIRAFSDSLMSVQVHQSMLNNTLEQMIARHEPITIEELLTRAAGIFGQDVSLPADLPEDVTIQFTETRPITIEIDDERLWITMRVESLRKSGQQSLRRFVVRAAYKTRVDGLNAELVRDGHLSISGPGMSVRQRLPIRLVFNKVLSDDRPIGLTRPALANSPAAEGLAITQCEMRDGWIGVGIGPKRAERVASR